MPYLILVRHAKPAINQKERAARWKLSGEGQTKTHLMAEQLKRYQPDIVVTSQEPKAAETGRIIAQALDLPCQTAENLHEHERTAEWLNHEKFQQLVQELFQRPSQLVFGLETAEQALHRFETAVNQTIAAHPNQNIIIATHGTVMTLLIAAHNPLAPIPFWQKLQMPDFVVLLQPDHKLFRQPLSKPIPPNVLVRLQRDFLSPDEEWAYLETLPFFESERDLFLRWIFLESPCDWQTRARAGQILRREQEAELWQMIELLVDSPLQDDNGTALTLFETLDNPRTFELARGWLSDKFSSNTQFEAISYLWDIYPEAVHRQLQRLAQDENKTVRQRAEKLLAQ